MLSRNDQVRLKRILGFSAIASIVTMLVLTLSGTGQPLSAKATSQVMAEFREAA
jgi:hypothetical protein